MEECDEQGGDHLGVTRILLAQLADVSANLNNAS
jgi:hypothetical protein